MLVLGAAFLAVFWEAAFGGVRHLLGAQMDLLPPLMVYASLCTGITTVTLLAVLRRGSGSTRFPPIRWA